MISTSLSLWIAQSESWQTFIDFDLPTDSIANYQFLERPDDFYISLFGEMYDILENVEGKKGDILSVAKGLEIFSLQKKSDNFYGVDKTSNILYAAGLYYLSDYSASAYILANLFEASNYENEISQFVWCFLKRKMVSVNRFCSLFSNYLNTGDEKYIRRLTKEIQKSKELSYKGDPVLFSVCFLAEAIINKFKDNNIWSDLLKHNNQDYWGQYVARAIKKPFPVWDFFPSQKAALDKNILSTFQSIALQTPTSSGKTAICELIIYNEFKKNPQGKILYLAPFRALAAELKQSFGANLARLGITSKTIYGGNIPTGAEKELIQNVTLLISTPEKFMALENSLKDFLKDFTMIICDEGHLLDDKNRGLNYELLLSRLKSQKETNRKFVFISAIIPNIDKVNTWLGGNNDTVISSKYRATEIEYGFVRDFDNDSCLLDVNPFKRVPQNYKLNKFLTTQDFTFQGKRKERVYKWHSPKVRSVAIALKALNSGSVALFSPTKGGNSGVAALAKEVITQLELGLNLPNPASFIKIGSEVITRLKEYFKVIFGEEYTLCKIVEFGALYHHGDLPQYVREVIEDTIRKEEIKLIICTNTLAEGVNLPLRTIVINSARRFNEKLEFLQPIDLRDLKNLVGRAGRAGKETKGLVVVVNPNDFATMEQVIKDENIEKVNGHLYSIINSISKVIVEKRLVLTNEILEAQDEEFDELIDSVDISIIDLLGEEIQASELKDTIESLINETFAKHQSSEDEESTLKSLVNLRGDKLTPYIESKEFKYIKQSGSTIRGYKELSSNLSLENPLWSTLTNPVDDAWIDFILDLVSNVSVVNYQFSEFNRINKTSFTFAELKAVIKLWITGNWFNTISEICGGDVDITLRLMNSIVGYHIQSTIASAIRIAEMKYLEESIVLSIVVTRFPQFLLYGLNNQLQLDLVELGFNDRIGIIELARLITEYDVYYNDLNELRSYLREKRSDLLSEMDKNIPKISISKLEESFRYLGIANIR